MAEQSYLGRFPFEPDQKRPVLMTHDKLKMFIYTEENPESSDLNWIIASTENGTVGMYQLAPGSTFDPVDVHAGDEVYYIIKGIVTMFNLRLGQAVEVHEGESLLIPKGAPHKAYNFTDDETLILYTIAPRMWESNASPLEFNEKFKLYKHETREEQ